MKMLGDFVLIKKQERPTESAGGIALPTPDQTLPEIGTVMAHGPGITTIAAARIPMQIKVGDKVQFQKNVGKLTEVNGEPMLIVSEQQIYGVME